ncbi:hypothetical protein J6590_029991 [Homalodisca vitripennis]|nr:hypothetical protein J6590_029991 [Homalodisca vitripennis]
MLGYVEGVLNLGIEYWRSFRKWPSWFSCKSCRPKGEEWSVGVVREGYFSKIPEEVTTAHCTFYLHFPVYSPGFSATRLCLSHVFARSAAARAARVVSGMLRGVARRTVYLRTPVDFLKT